jgi:hypothetical protein
MIAAAGLLAIFAVPSFAAINKVELVSKLSGKKEIPGPGDKDATGEAQVKLNVPKKKVRFAIEYQDMVEPFAGHIHKGDKANAGPIKVELFSSETDSFPSPVTGVVEDVKKKLLKRIANNPQNFYVNLHNEEFEDGAIRGQLKLAPRSN